MLRRMLYCEGGGRGWSEAMKRLHLITFLLISSRKRNSTGSDISLQLALSPSLPSDHYGWINHYCSLCSSFALLLPLFLLLLLLQTISADATASLAAKTRSVCHSLGLSCCFLKNCTPRVCSLALSLSFPSPQLHQV